MIIALKGPAQCGKSTLAGMLEAELVRRGIQVRRTAFGDFVRREILAYIQTCSIDQLHRISMRNQVEHTIADIAYDIHRTNWVDDPFMEDVRNATGNPNARFSWPLFLKHRPAHLLSRKIQQLWGQDFRRAQDPLYWIKQSFAHNVEFILQDNTILIEESCRQPNEGRYVKALGGIILDLMPLPSPTESEASALSHSVEQIAMSWKGDESINMAEIFAMPPEDRAIWIRDLVGMLLIDMEATFGRTEAPH